MGLISIFLGLSTVHFGLNVSAATDKYDFQLGQERVAVV